VLNLTRLSFCRVEDDSSANKVDHNEEHHGSANEALRRALSSSQPHAQQELEKAHEDKHSQYLMTSKPPRLILLLAEQTEHAHDGGNEHDLCSQVHCLCCSPQPRVMRITDSGQSAVELEGVAEEATERSVLGKLFHLVFGSGGSSHPQLYLAEQL